ncbi:MAG TPA: hypothetical protein VMO26_29085 [Vicinamibacterales bacterium]|nr:hypothetical protein [Vicinamibacterales bacterium]
MIESSSFRTTLDADTGIIARTLNRPERLNALTFEVYGELCTMFKRARDEAGARDGVVDDR